jgi:hypothetical protein
MIEVQLTRHQLAIIPNRWPRNDINGNYVDFDCGSILNKLQIDLIRLDARESSTIKGWIMAVRLAESGDR